MSSFAWHGKKTVWKAWKICPAITVALECLSNGPDNLSDDIMREIEIVVIVMYIRTCPLSNINEAR